MGSWRLQSDAELHHRAIATPHHTLRRGLQCLPSTSINLHGRVRWRHPERNMKRGMYTVDLMSPGVPLQARHGAHHQTWPQRGGVGRPKGDEHDDAQLDAIHRDCSSTPNLVHILHLCIYWSAIHLLSSNERDGREVVTYGMRRALSKGYLDSARALRASRRVRSCIRWPFEHFGSFESRRKVTFKAVYPKEILDNSRPPARSRLKSLSPLACPLFHLFHGHVELAKWRQGGGRVHRWPSGSCWSLASHYHQ